MASQYTPSQVAAINAARAANVTAGRPANSGAGATSSSSSQSSGVAPSSNYLVGVTPDDPSNAGQPQVRKSTGTSKVGTSTTPNPNPAGTPGYNSEKLNNSGPDSKFVEANDATKPEVLGTLDDFYAEVNSKLSPVISAIQLAENASEQNANLDATRKTSETNALLGARGLAGSSEGNAQASAVEQERQAAIATAKADQASKIADTVKWAIPEAQTEFQNAQTRNDQNSKDYVATQTAKAQQTIKSLPGSLDDLKTNNLDSYNHLLQYYGGNENLMKSDWIAGHANTIVGDPIVNGNKLTFVRQDPITGAHTTETLDIPGGSPLSPNDVKVVPNEGIFVRDTTDPTGQTWKSAGGANPLYGANQEATLASKNAMLVSRYGTAVNNITKQLFPTPTSNPLNLYANSLNYTTKLNEAYKLSKSTDGTDKGPSDLELIDAAVKINNGGQQVTETQVNALFHSLNYAGKATIEGGKLTGVSALLTDGQRDAIKTLAEGNVKAQQQNAINATKVISDRAIRAGVPADKLSTPEDIMALSAAADTAQTGQPTPDDISSMTSAGYTYNPDDGTMTDTTDGNVYTFDGFQWNVE